jgi:predicted nucleotide-binding protein
MSKYHGELEDLRDAVDRAGLRGEWTANDKGTHTFRAKTGEVLNWYATGTLQFQGSNQSGFRSALEGLLLAEEMMAAQPKPEAKTAHIFIVHGHDREARDQLELVLMRLGLQPFILQNQDGGSKTIIEALEKNIYSDAAFGIVLMTPDDYGYAKAGTDADRQPRARQNVILEMGMVMAALGRDKMAILKKGALEVPSDTDGIIRLEFNERVQEIVPKLVQRLSAAGIDIDMKKIAAASA